MCSTRTGADSPIGVDTTEELGLEVHVIETIKMHISVCLMNQASSASYALVNDLVPVGLNFVLVDILKLFFPIAPTIRTIHGQIVVPLHSIRTDIRG